MNIHQQHLDGLDPTAAEGRPNGVLSYLLIHCVQVCVCVYLLCVRVRVCVFMFVCVPVHVHTGVPVCEDLRSTSGILP